MKGFRAAPSGSKKELLKNLQTEVRNLQMAVRINQMMTQQVIQQFQRSNKDIENLINMFNDLQYRTLAMVELGGNSDKIDEVADRIKLKDYNTASDKEDAEKKYAVGDVVKPESIVIITSDAEDNKGIFRSKFKLSDCGVPELQQALEGKHVGDKVQVKLNNLDHEVELLGVREETVPEPTVADVSVNTESENDGPVVAVQ